MSAAGKEVLIKSIAHVIPVFSMSCFRLPRGLCESIASIIRRFRGEVRKGRENLCWVSWDVITKPNSPGGLGFRDMELFNLSLLSR
jgi:hypothetical protein